VIWIGVDAHKQVHEAIAIDQAGVLGQRRLPNTPEAWAELLGWAQQWPERMWAVEGAWYLGRGLAQYLTARGERVHEVNGRWTAARRRGMRIPGKNDSLDARSVATLLREEAETLPRVYAEEDELASVELWSRTQAELTKDLTRLMNRLHELLLQCDPRYKDTLPPLTTKAAIETLETYTAPGSGMLAREREALVRATAAQLALLDEQDRELRRKLERVSKARFSPLRQIEGIGPQIACAIVAEVGSPRPGFGQEQLAALGGLCPLEASSAETVRHRLNRLGNRRLNMLFHQIVLTQSRIYPPARTYLLRRQAEGRTAREARRALKRLIVRRVFHAWTSCFISQDQRVAA
jgi:transposase